METQSPGSVSVENVSKTYRSRRSGETLAVRSVSFDVDPGTIVALVGPSGSGKSTLLKIIAGLIRPSDGRVTISGKVVAGPGAETGLMFQSPVLLPWRSVIRNVLLPVHVSGRKDTIYQKRAEELLGQVGLGGWEHRHPRELSGGMQQRVAICRALISDPRVLLLDEPFGALDSMTREQLNDLLARLCEQTHKTTLLVTHDIDEAIYLGDRILVLSDRPGRVIADVRIEIPRPRSFEIRQLPQFEKHAVEIRRLLGFSTAK